MSVFVLPVIVFILTNAEYSNNFGQLILQAPKTLMVTPPLCMSQHHNLPSYTWKVALIIVFCAIAIRVVL